MGLPGPSSPPVPGPGICTWAGASRAGIRRHVVTLRMHWGPRGGQGLRLRRPDTPVEVAALQAGRGDGG